jgi:hypothetical protein
MDFMEDLWPVLQDFELPIPFLFDMHHKIYNNHAHFFT